MIKLKIITPLGLYKEGEVEAVHVTTVDGETTILSNHMPIVAMLKTCKCTLSEHKEQRIMLWPVVCYSLRIMKCAF